ncbi:MAG: CIA30 family protein [Rubripirellula sp.]
MTSLFDFSESSDTEKWQIVNDGVMGGRSSSQASIVSVDAGGESSPETTSNCKPELAEVLNVPPLPDGVAGFKPSAP